MPAKQPEMHIDCKACGKNFRVWKHQLPRKKFCSKACLYKGGAFTNLFEKGHPDLVPKESRGHTIETREKISSIQRAKGLRGELHPNWKSGARSERKQAMSRYEYRDWRKAVFERDNYTCQMCHQRGGTLNADHIVPWCASPELRYEVANGRTLCVSCHMALDTHGIGALKYKVSANG